MLRKVWHLGFALSLALVSLPASAQGQPGEQQIAAGNELLASGKAAYNDGHFREALQDFEQAYQRTQRASILYRIGDTADKLGDHERAVTAFQQYLDATPGASDADFIQSRIAANRRALSNPEAPSPAPASNAAALSPEAAAQTATPSDASNAAPADASAPRDGKDLKRAWWLWAGAGVVAIAAIVVIAVAVSSSSTHAVAPVKGNVGGTVNTLEGP